MDTLESTCIEIITQLQVFGKISDPSSKGGLKHTELLSHPYYSIKRACESLGDVALTYREDIEGTRKPGAGAEGPQAMPAGWVSLSSSCAPTPASSGSSSSSSSSLTNNAIALELLQGNVTTSESMLSDDDIFVGGAEKIDWIFSVPFSLDDAKLIIENYRDKVKCGIIINLDDEVLTWSDEERLLRLGAKRVRDTEIYTPPISDNVFDDATFSSEDDDDLQSGRVWYVWIESQELLAKTAEFIHIRG